MSDEDDPPEDDVPSRGWGAIVCTIVTFSPSVALLYTLFADGVPEDVHPGARQHIDLSVANFDAGVANFAPPAHMSALSNATVEGCKAYLNTLDCEWTLRHPCASTPRTATGVKVSSKRASAPFTLAHDCCCGPYATSDPDDEMCLNGRRLPSLFVIGAQKCGTTALTDRMMKNSACMGVFPGHKVRDGAISNTAKERHHFSEPMRSRRGLAYYALGLPPCGGSRQQAGSFDATPNYLHITSSADRLLASYSRQRLRRTTVVVLLCDPVQRAQSAFYHFRRMVKHWDWAATIVSNGSWDFGQQVRHDIARGRLGRSDLYRYGEYAPQLEHWARAVGGHARLLAIPSIAFARRPDAILEKLMQDVRTRAGIARPPADCAQLPERNFAGYSISKFRGHGAGTATSFEHKQLLEDVEGDDLERLSAWFQESNRRTHALVRQGAWELFGYDSDRSFLDVDVMGSERRRNWSRVKGGR